MGEVVVSPALADATMHTQGGHEKSDPGHPCDPRIEYKDVVITKWPPAERVYGKT